MDITDTRAAEAAVPSQQTVINTIIGESQAASLALGAVAAPNKPGPLTLTERAVVVSELKQLAKQIEAAVEEHTAAFCAEAETVPTDELPIVDGKRAIRVQANRATFPDGDGLLTYLINEKVDQAVIDSFLTKDVKISNPALEKAIKEGRISAALVEPFMVVKPSKPYIGWEKVETEA